MRARTALCVAVLAALLPAAVAGLAGCSHNEEKAEAGYYTGPFHPAGRGKGSVGADRAGTPATPGPPTGARDSAR